MPDIRLEGIALDGPDGGPVFRNLNLALQAGDSLQILGGTGFARGQLLKLASGLLQPLAGSTRINGQWVWPGEGLAGCPKRPRMGFAFARGGLIANLNLQENLQLPTLFGTERPTDEIKGSCQDLLSRFSLLPMAGLRPHALDSRTRKLAHLMRVRLLDPELIFLDDPLAGLYEGDRVEIEAWIQAWAEDKARILMATTPEEDAHIPGILRRMKLRDRQLEDFP